MARSKRKWNPDTNELEDEGPEYPDLGPGVASLRRKAIANPDDREASRKHGEAVLAAIGRLNNRALTAAGNIGNPHCASGSAENEGYAILRAVKADNLRRFNASITRDRKARTDEQIRDAYNAAMRLKRNAAV